MFGLLYLLIRLMVMMVVVCVLGRVGRHRLAGNAGRYACR